MDIIHKYNADEARNLKQYGELPETARINETAVDMAMEGDANDDLGIDPTRSRAWQRGGACDDAARRM